MKDRPKCIVEWCKNTSHGKQEYCQNHVKEYKKYGNIDENRRKKKIEKKPCSVEGCNNICKVNIYCDKHYHLYRKYGYIKEIVKRKDTVCIIDGCKNEGHTKGYCKKHYNMMIYKNNKKSENILITNKGHKCIINGCDRMARTKGYCQKHYSMFYYYNKIGNLDEFNKKINNIIKK